MQLNDYDNNVLKIQLALLLCVALAATVLEKTLQHLRMLWDN